VLAGLRVLEFGQIAAGPFAGSLLADLGADVVKVEKPDGGDEMRRWPPVSEGGRGPGYSENFRPGVLDRLGVDRFSYPFSYPSLRTALPRPWSCAS
jgi:crotonobetainyl-CoA:carnitine CoA-transferase CaiB-like acyl-CoA transferase